jgi:sulfatase maturation enzyme AslB (radical SAM superfamily)
MANLMLTTACNLRCPYCFGLDMFGSGQKRHTMAEPLFHDLLDWIDRADLPWMDIHLMGGEPTLHPAFGNMLEELAKKKRKIMIFSNASAPLSEAVFRRSAELGAAWIVNCNPPEVYRENQLEQLHQHLSWLGQAATVTLNIASERTPYRHVFDYIERFGLTRQIKLGIALPTIIHVNEHAQWEKLPAIAAHVMQLFHEAQQRQIGLEFECGVPYCLFNEAQKAELGNIHLSHCGSRLDITPTGDVINCLPLSGVVAVPFRKFEHYGLAREWFQRMQSPYRQVGCDSRCMSCAHRLDGCCSACLAYGMGEYNRIILPPLPDCGQDVRGGIGSFVEPRGAERGPASGGQ